MKSQAEHTFIQENTRKYMQKLQRKGGTSKQGLLRQDWLLLLRESKEDRKRTNLQEILLAEMNTDPLDGPQMFQQGRIWK